MPFKDRAPLDFDLDDICEQAVSRARRNIRIADDYDEPMELPFSPGSSWQTAEMILIGALSLIMGFGGMWIYEIVIR
ncbi:hypothetical protein [Mesorhizobium sp. M7A.F.Ca.CA.002.12.1.1]|uniref:hypothetical protein n=1 Tax=Mesorhizobium sp. M7A.F.Ca.CA.002.12.1.1 TaxID=2496735 RepID=UPI000FCAA250|nr:hypothetical protein [Mesorhizobium sp. M7A.F.Ca.CA.002.12.1.1]RUX60144.1 hypothetical protein EN989_11025 [Mesorhizobium sp. M7A.F.Ca.CA.002.12.1.1]